MIPIFLFVHSEEAIIKKDGSLAYIDDYHPTKQSRHDELKLGALMCFEAAGFNCLGPLANAAENGLPLVDCDLAGRSVAELQVTYSIS